MRRFPAALTLQVYSTESRRCPLDAWPTENLAYLDAMVGRHVAGFGLPDGHHLWEAETRAIVSETPDESNSSHGTNGRNMTWRWKIRVSGGFHLHVHVIHRQGG